MTNSQRLTLRASEIRQRLNEIAGLEGDAFTDEIRAESDRLTTEYRDTETKLRAAVIAEGDEAEQRAAGHIAETAEDRERRELRGRARLHRYIGAVIEKRQLDGAEAEYSAAMGVGGLVPLSLFGGTAEERVAEWRARQQRSEHRAVTPGPAAADSQTNQAPVVPALFDRSVAPFLGIEMPTVGIGVASYPVLSTSLTAGIKANSDNAPETAGAFTVATAEPKRLTGALRIRRTDVAKLADLESSLRENLSMVISDQFDAEGLNGDNTDDALNGILQQLTDPTAPAANAETYARYQTALSSHIDGLFATGPTDVRMLAGVETVRHMLGVYRANEDATTAHDMATMKYGGVRATRRIAAPASNIQQAVIRRTNPAGDRVAVAPVWGGMELIRDPYSDAGKGEIVITAIMLIGGVVLLRSGAFVQDSFRLA